MMSAPDIRKLTSLSTEARQSVTTAFDALARWRDEIFSANDRCLTKVLDQMAVAQRAIGWPDHVTAAAREHLLKASKIQTQMIDQVMDAWERQLKSPSVPSSVPEGFMLQMPALSRSASTDPMSEMMRLGEMTLVPFKLWMQAAETWQRNWMAIISGSVDSGPSRPIKKAA